MKIKTLVFLSSLISLSAWSQTIGKPFQLSPGKYTYECWQSGILKGIGGQDDSRFSSYHDGSTSIMQQDDSYIEIGDANMEGSTVRYTSKTTDQDLGNGKFRRLSQTNEIVKFLGEYSAYETKIDATLEVDRQVMRVLESKVNQEKSKVSSDELVWKKMDDGRIVVTSYLRSPKSLTLGGVKSEVIVSQSLCIFKPIQSL